MPYFVIHRIQREEIPADPLSETPTMTGIKFFPIRERSGELYLIDAEDEPAAFACAGVAFPNLRHFLAVQPLGVYQNDLARFDARAAARLQAGGIPERIFPNAANRRPRNEVPASLRRESVAR